MPSLIESRHAAYEAAVARMHEAAEAIETADESADLDALQADFDAAQEDVERHQQNLARAQQIQEAREAHPIQQVRAAQADPRPAAGAAGATDVRVTVDRELTYRQDRGSFFGDAFAARYLGDQGAAQRLQRHAQEMDTLYRDRGIILHDGGRQQRDVGTGAFAGLTVPQYLVDEYAALARAGRPYANSIRSLPLPASGMTLNISRITTGSAVAAQATENSNVQETDMDDTLLTIDVRTYSGQQDVSRQALERSEMVDSIVYADLALAYHTTLDSAVLNGAGTSGTHLGLRSVSGITAVTYTDASPTVGEAYPKIADAIQQMNSGRYLPATAILMHPRRWGWFTAALDTAGRPLVVPTANGPMNAAGVGEAAGYGQVVGTMHGLPVITDANLPTNLGAGTNEDIVIVYRAPDHILWEEADGMPRRLRFEETLGNQLTVKLVVYGYSAYTAGRYPLAASTVGGTGLVTPTF